MHAPFLVDSRLTEGKKSCILFHAASFRCREELQPCRNHHFPRVSPKRVGIASGDRHATHHCASERRDRATAVGHRAISGSR
jgi:hypothetical protein